MVPPKNRKGEKIVKRLWSSSFGLKADRASGGTNVGRSPYVKRHIGAQKTFRGLSVTSEAVACYRLYAANCIELAKSISDVDRRVFLFNMARDWLRLADQAERNGDAGSGGAPRPRDAHPEPPPDG